MSTTTQGGIVNGYVIGTTWNEDIATHPAVRYARELDDGGLFAAYESDRAQAYELTAFGKVYPLVEPHPDWPDSWPKPLAPKRGAIHEDERFSLIVPRHVGWVSLHELASTDGVREAAIVIAPDGYLRILVTTGREHSVSDVEWSGAVRARVLVG